MEKEHTMNRTQKVAWFKIKVIAVGGVLSVLVILISLLTNAKALTYFGVFVLAVAALVAGLASFLIHREPGRVNFDERDANIEKKAYLVGYGILWCVFIVTCMIAIPKIGSAILAVTLAVVKAAESIAILVQHGREADES